MHKIKERILNNENIKDYIIYTIIYFVAIIIIFFPFYELNNSFIWQTDGFKQHFAILYNFNQTIRENFGNIVNGLNTFSWNIGIGGDIIGEFSYYILGDPFAYISLLFPMDKLQIAYNFLVLLRIYFVGISFIIYCKYNKKPTFNTIIGTIVYSFCGYILYAGVRHPYFTNALIMLPIIFLGIDKILRENKGKVFTFSIAIMAIMNYYFLYMVTILAIIYAVIKYLVEYKKKDYRDLGKKSLKATLCYISGIGIAAIIFLPIIYAFFNSNRLSDVNHSYYTIKYYKSLFVGLISNKCEYWTRICVSSIVILMLPISLYKFFKEKQNKENRAILINILINVIMLLFVNIGSLMNGFSFQSNRWVFGFVFLLSYLVTININSKLKYTKKEVYLMLGTLLFYYILVVMMHMLRLKYVLISFVISMIMFILIAICNIKKVKIVKKVEKIIPYIFTIIVLCSIFNYSNQLYVTNKYAKSFVKNNKVMELYSNYDNELENFENVICDIKKSDREFYRITDSVESNDINMPLIYKYNGTNTYLSVGNKYIGKLCKDLMIRNYKDTNPLQKLDGRTKILELLANKYFITNEKNKEKIPYNYKLNKTIKGKKDDNTYIFKNENSLGLGVFYDSYILKEDYEKFSSLEKEQAALDVAVLQNETSEIKEYDIKNNKQIIEEIKEKTSKECLYQIIDKDEIMKDNNIIKTNSENKTIIFQLNEEIQNSELYLYIDGLKIKSNSSYTITANYRNITKKQTIRNKIKDAYYVDMKGILINLGYKDIHKGDIKITFSSKGTYEYNSIKLIAVPMDSYNNSIKKLKETELKITECKENYIKGSIDNKTSGILQLSIPYTKGFKVYVDGKKTDTVNVNTAFIGIFLEKGVHEIYLKYETPLLKQGIIISLSTIIILLIYESYKYLNKKLK